jgi:hypothetical protein
VRKSVVLLLISAFLVATPLLSSTASAVMFGTVDQENNYPYVGLVVFYDKKLVPLWRCSGALISETVFLTKGRQASPLLGGKIFKFLNSLKHVEYISNN